MMGIRGSRGDMALVTDGAMSWVGGRTQRKSGSGEKC